MPKKKPAIDPAHIETERILARLERRIAREYSQASKEIDKTLKDYFKRFEAKDKTWRQWVKEGKKTEKEYRDWRYGQMAVGKRWESLKEQITTDLQNVNNIAKSVSRGYMPEVYALNHNFATYQIETGGLIDTSYTLYSRESVERMLRDDPELLPPPGKKVSEKIAAGLDVKWNRQQIQSVMMQGILQGENIPELAKRLRKVTDKNKAASIRNARTMATGAQNAGRIDAAIRARRMGVDLIQQWEAALDMRTRTDHRLLHGQRREIGEAFVVPAGGEHAGTEIMYPGDPACSEPAELYNCRCTLLTWVRGYEHDAVKESDGLEGMSFEEWLKAKPVSNRITLPEEKASAIRGAWIKKYKEG